MFIANDAFEVPFAAALGPAGARYFRTMELSTRTTWYLVNFYLRDDPMKLLHTFCGWDQEVLEWLNHRERFNITSLQQIRATRGASAGWQMCSVRRIWTAWSAQQEQDLLIFEDESGGLHEGLLGDQASGALEQRKLIAEFTA